MFSIDCLDVSTVAVRSAAVAVATISSLQTQLGFRVGVAFVGAKGLDVLWA